MTTPHRTISAVEPAGPAETSPVAPVLQLVSVSDAPAEDLYNHTRRAIRERLDTHVVVARRLGVDPLTVDERATAMLDTACDGWRANRRCVGEDGQVLDSHHPTCLRAQYHHDVLLLEHGLLSYERTGQ